MSPCATTEPSSGRPARPKAICSRSPTVVPTTAAPSAEPTLTSLFQVRPVDEVLEDIALASRRIPDVRRVFLCDGNALVLDMERLSTVLDALNAAFPLLRRISIYANAPRHPRQIGKRPRQCFARRALELIYLGLESGCDKVLRRVDKGATAADMIAAVPPGKTGRHASVGDRPAGTGGNRAFRPARRRHGRGGERHGSPVSLDAHADACAGHAASPPVAGGRVPTPRAGSPCLANCGG